MPNRDLLGVSGFVRLLEVSRWWCLCRVEEDEAEGTVVRSAAANGEPVVAVDDDDGSQLEARDFLAPGRFLGEVEELFSFP